jgi:hypothetical protein
VNYIVCDKVYEFIIVNYFQNENYLHYYHHELTLNLILFRSVTINIVHACIYLETKVFVISSLTVDRTKVSSH